MCYLQSISAGAFAGLAHMRRREFLGIFGWAATWPVAPKAQASLAFSKSLGLTIRRQKREAKSLRKRFSGWVGRLATISRSKLETLGAISTTFDAMRQN